MKITKSLLKALNIIANFEQGDLCQEIWPRRFAELMWPDSECWHKSYKIGGYGATKGKGMWLCAGSYLNKLREAGVVYQRAYHHMSIYGITRAGLERLKESQEESK